MLTNPTSEKLIELRLYGMSKSLNEQYGKSDYEELTFDERLGIMVDREILERQNRLLQNHLKQAKLKQQACIENIDYSNKKGLDKTLVRSLATCKWLKENLNVLITAPCGVGKSYIACALGHSACMHGSRVLYTRATRLLEELALARGDGRYPRTLSKLARTELLIIDDFGLTELNNQECQDLMEIIEDRHNVHSTIVASQLPIAHWHETMKNPTLADAIMDRIVHNSYKIELIGDSMRKKKRMN